jgi:3alpha(or 20beta)-hydroxysteroid dehydrogenase
LALAAEGATVVLADVLDEEGKATAADIAGSASYRHLDVTSEDEWTDTVRAVVAEHGRLDVLVNNAGILHIAPTVMTAEADYRRVIDVNQIGVFLGMKAVIPTMTDQQSGSIVNISSVAGLIAAPALIAYGAAKWAVRGMTKSVAIELASFGVRANSVHPGIIDTPMLEQFDAWGMTTAVEERIPLGHRAPASDVAALVLFLASDESRYCTGAEFVIDGGMTAI